MFTRYSVPVVLVLFFSLNTANAMEKSKVVEKDQTNVWGKTEMQASEQDVLDIDQAFAKLGFCSVDGDIDVEVEHILSKEESSSTNAKQEFLQELTEMSDEQFRYEMGRRTVARELEEKEESQDLAVALLGANHLPEVELIILKRKELSHKEQQALKLVAGTLFKKPRTPKNYTREELAFEQRLKILAEATRVNSAAALHKARLLKRAATHNASQIPADVN